MKIILASKSPRRKEILENLKIEFDIVVSDADESSEIKNPRELVKELALRKGRAVADFVIESDRYKGCEDSEIYIISSDTVVATKLSEDGEILGKPKDKSDAKRMLRLLSGKKHSVCSGIAIIKLIKTENGCKIAKIASDTEKTEVEFAEMTEKDIEFYINSENVMDKAGAYAIQGIACAYINKIDGDYFNVVGLPCRRMFRLFQSEFGIAPQDLIKS